MQKDLSDEEENLEMAVKKIYGEDVTINIKNRGETRD